MISYDYYHPVALSSSIDLGLARAHRNDPLIFRYCRQHTLISQREQEAWADRQYRDRKIKMYGITDGHVQLGVCGFTSMDRQNRSAEFSLYIGPEHQSNNYGMKALATLCKHGFEDWGFNRIWGEVFEGNPALEKFEKLGFKREGRLRETYFRKGKFIDSHIISILATEASF